MKKLTSNKTDGSSASTQDDELIVNMPEAIANASYVNIEAPALNYVMPPPSVTGNEESAQCADRDR